MAAGCTVGRFIAQLICSILLTKRIIDRKVAD